MEGGSANPWQYSKAAWKATVPLGHSVMGTYGKPGRIRDAQHSTGWGLKHTAAVNTQGGGWSYTVNIPGPGGDLRGLAALEGLGLGLGREGKQPAPCLPPRQRAVPSWRPGFAGAECTGEGAAPHSAVLTALIRAEKQGITPAVGELKASEPHRVPSWSSCRLCLALPAASSACSILCLALPAASPPGLARWVSSPEIGTFSRTRSYISPPG